MKNFIQKAFKKRKGKKKKGFVLVIGVDIVGAFNNAWWAKILYELRKKKCPKNLFLLSKSYFSVRKAKLWYLNVEVIRELTVGCPQGSACGPWFWNTFYDDALKLKLNEEKEIEGIADDTTLEIYADTIEELEMGANRALELLCEWAHINKLEFNASKTICVLFTKRQNYREPEIFLNNEKLKLSPSFKHLGVYLDSKLNFKTHAKYIKTKTSLFVMNLLRFAKLKYGLNARALETTYKSAVLPIISYACSTWFECIDKKGVQKPLITLQRQIAFRIKRA